MAGGSETAAATVVPLEHPAQAVVAVVVAVRVDIPATEELEAGGRLWPEKNKV